MKLVINFLMLLFSLLFSTNLWAQIPEFESRFILGSNQNDDDVIALSATSDDDDNIYVTGSFKGVVTVKKYFGSATYIYSNGDYDIFILKIDSENNLIWSKTMGSSSTDRGNSISVDADGNVYTTGSFSGTVDFDPNTGTHLISSNGETDIFVQKLDSEGNLLWAKNMGGIDDDKGESITSDDNGNVYTIGSFQDITDLDPNAGEHSFTSNGFTDVFIQKLDENGNFLWAHQLGDSSLDYGHSISTDPNGNIYASGAIEGTVDFDPGPGTLNLSSNGFIDIFIQKLDSAGNLLWAKVIGGSGNDACQSIVCNENGNTYSTGFFSGTVDFDTGSETSSISSNGLYDIFVQKLDEDGNILWLKQMGGVSYDDGQAINIDTNGDVYITGSFEGVVDFDPNSGTVNFNSNGFRDAFILKLNTYGYLRWVRRIGGPGYEDGLAITTNTNNAVYPVGRYTDYVDIFPNPDETWYLDPYKSPDVYILKFSQTTVGIIENSFDENVQVWPNPSNGDFAIEFESLQEKVSVRVSTISGQFMETKTFSNTKFSRMKVDYPIGVYLIEIKNDKGYEAVIRLVKQ